MKNIFITGSTGFLGWEMVRELLKDDGVSLYLLSRSKKNRSAEERIKGLLDKDYSKSDIKKIEKRINIIEGDVTLPGLGIDEDVSNKLYKDIDLIYHIAALCEFGVEWDRIKKINVDGTENALNFAKRCNGLKRFNHVSTVALAGDSKGIFKEDYLDRGQGFHNTYEKSKYLAEGLVHRYGDNGLPVSIFRPGVVIGDSSTGDTSNFQMFYQFLHILSLELFEELPVNKNVRYGFVPVDYVAKAICLISKDCTNDKTYHLVNPDTITFDVFLDRSSGYFGFRKPRLTTKDKFDFSSLKGFRKRLIEFYLPYMIHEEIDFDMKNFNRSLNGSLFRWPKIDDRLLETLFKYCHKIGYIKRKRR